MTTWHVEYLDVFTEWASAQDRGGYHDLIQDEIWSWISNGPRKPPDAEPSDADPDVFTYWVGRYGIVFQVFTAPKPVPWIVVLDII